MKYLKYREDFLHKEIKLDESKIQEQIKSSEMISEAFENDITWGGSLIGRLFNSILRKGKVMVQTARIGSLVKSLKDELDALSGEVQIASDKKIKEKVYILAIRFLVTEIYNIVVSNKSVAEKKGELVGDGSETSGLIQVTIKKIESIPDESLPNKKELIEKLKRFREALLKLSVEAEPTKDDEPSTDDNDLAFYNQTINLLKSVVALNDVIVNKKIKTTKVEIGKEYTNKNGKVCMVVSLDHVITRPNKETGGDGVFFTKDDKKGEKLDPSLVLVVYRDDKTKKYLPNSPTQAIKRMELKPYDGKDTIKDKQGKPLQAPLTTPTPKQKFSTGSAQSQEEKEKSTKTNDSFYYENESLPIFEDTEVKDNESHTRAAWNKVLNTWNKTGISKMVPRIQELLKKAEAGGETEKKWIMDLGKQVILNKSTVGANPIKFEELIKEAESIPTSYNDIPKAISLVSRIILSFKEDMGLLGSLGDANSSLKLFITSFGEMDKIYPTLKKTEKKEEKTPETQNDSVRLFNYYRFLSINEADEESELSAETEQTKDDVKTAWFNEFKEGEEKEWKVEEKEAKELQKETEELEKKETTFKGDDYYDHIIAIIEIFGKAYNLYATTVIPSGRPNGRISQKTFREYEYIGDGTNPGWREGEGPSTGPWAAKQTYQKWQDGVMGILKDPKYRTILANVKFVSEAEKSTGTPSKSGSGPSLFTFINDLTTGNGEFSKIKREVLKKYFTTKEMQDEADKETNGYNGNPEPIISEDDKGSTNEYYLTLGKNIGGIYVSPKLSDYKKSDKDNTSFLNNFILCKYKTDESKEGTILAYINNRFTVDDESHILIKFQFVKDGKQSLISSYLNIKESKIKLPTDIKEELSATVYIGIIKLSDGHFLTGSSPTIKYIEATKVKSTTTEEDFKEMKIKLTDVKYLTKLVNIKGGNQKRIVVKPEDPLSLNFTSKDVSGVLDKIKNSDSLKKGFKIEGKIK